MTSRLSLESGPFRSIGRSASGIACRVARREWDGKPVLPLAFPCRYSCPHDRRGVLGMRGRFLVVIVLGCVGLAAAADSADLTGLFHVDGSPYPDLGAGGGVVVTLATEGWTVTNTTTFDIWPAIADSQRLEIERAVGDLVLRTTATFSFTGITFEPLDVALAGDVWTAALPAEDPHIEVTCAVGAGATIGVADRYEFLDTTVALGPHWVTHSLVLHAQPAGVDSYVDAFVSLLQVTLGDGDSAITVGLTAFAETHLVPWEFSYAVLKAKVGLGRASFTGIVTYYGGTELTVALRLGLAFGPIAIDK